MKALAVVGTAALFLLIGTAVPAFAQEEHHEQEAKPEKKPAAKPAQHEEKAKPAEHEEKAKPAQHEEKAKPAQHEEHAKPAKQEENSKYAHDGQKDSHGHVYSASRFGRDHHARFVVTGGRLSHGRREYSYGGYWFYANAYPPWFYQQDVYFIMGADGFWYAVAYGDPSLTFQVDIE